MFSIQGAATACPSLFEYKWQTLALMSSLWAVMETLDTSRAPFRIRHQDSLHTLLRYPSLLQAWHQVSAEVQEEQRNKSRSSMTNLRYHGGIRENYNLFIFVCGEMAQIS